MAFGFSVISKWEERWGMSYQLDKRQPIHRANFPTYPHCPPFSQPSHFHLPTNHLSLAIKRQMFDELVCGLLCKLPWQYYFPLFISHHSMQGSPVSPPRPQLVEHLRQLLLRENLCNNTYLFKQMRANLALPLSVFAEERRVSTLTRDENELILALQQCGYVRVNGREVTVIEYPTFKLPAKNERVLYELNAALRETKRLYSFSERIEKEFLNLTLYEEDPRFLQSMLEMHGVLGEALPTSLYEDIRMGTARIQKMKAEHKNQGNLVGRNKYSLDKTPSIFIRRAVESDQEEGKGVTQGQGLNQVQGQEQGQGQKGKKKYKEAGKEKEGKEGGKQKGKEEQVKVKFSSQDFPSLP